MIFILGFGGRGGGFNNQTGPILVHIYPLFNSNVPVQYVGPLLQIQGYQGHRNVNKRRPHHSGDICTTRGNNLKTSLSYTCMGQNVKNVYYGLFGGP